MGWGSNAGREAGVHGWVPKQMEDHRPKDTVASQAPHSHLYPQALGEMLVTRVAREEGLRTVGAGGALRLVGLLLVWWAGHHNLLAGCRIQLHCPQQTSPFMRKTGTTCTRGCSHQQFLLGLKILPLHMHAQVIMRPAVVLSPAAEPAPGWHDGCTGRMVGDGLVVLLESQR